MPSLSVCLRAEPQPWKSDMKRMRQNVILFFITVFECRVLFSVSQPAKNMVPWSSHGLLLWYHSPPVKKSEKGEAQVKIKKRSRLRPKVKEKMAGKLTSFQAGQQSSFGSWVPFENLGEHSRPLKTMNSAQ
jgi:hypothetical protein